MLRDTSTQKHSHSRAGRPHQTTLQGTTTRQPRTPPHCRRPSRENGPRGTATGTEEEAYTRPQPRQGGEKRCDPFHDDLLPEDGPSLLDGLPDIDKENVISAKDGQDETLKVFLTPEMLKAEFTLINDQHMSAEQSLRYVYSSSRVS
ncbi:hypothetical protein NDU88_001010 [Pleurodeles waltl]|uniref:Uncharacterized protein n=1 Tax=Pleurodeles waltl TaxID=8319 RepID=A0AAV7TH27_PLEWA|nr:hypothetical protein NDU88_001010 [Pleurodeles waltl]